MALSTHAEAVMLNLAKAAGATAKANFTAAMLNREAEKMRLESEVIHRETELIRLRSLELEKENRERA